MQYHPTKCIRIPIRVVQRSNLPSAVKGLKIFSMQFNRQSVILQKPFYGLITNNRFVLSPTVESQKSQSQPFSLRAYIRKDSYGSYYILYLV